MKISIDTDVDSFLDATRAVHAAYGVPYDGSEAPGDEDGTDEDELEELEEEDSESEVDFFPGRWTRKRIRKLVQYVRGLDAEIALRFIAENAPVVDLDEVFAHLEERTGIEGFSGKHMGGRMSAMGAARKYVGGKVGRIYDTDYARRKYRMDERTAEVLLEELDVHA